MENKYLPLGTVVMLKKGVHKVMIVGYCTVSPELGENKMFDYMACLYPEGIFSLDKMLVFDHDDIDVIHQIGYSDDDQVRFNGKLLEMKEKYADENNNLKVSPDKIIYNEIQKKGVTE